MDLVIIVLLATFCSANAIEAGDCSNTKAVESLDPKKLEGKWYEFSSFGTPVSHRLVRCYETTVTAASDGKSFLMANDRILKLINIHIRTNWTVTTNDKVTGDLRLKFKVPFIGSVAVPFKILGTDDYKNFVILHACYTVSSIFKSNLGIVFTRKRHYEAKELESLYSSIDETLKKNGLSRSQFTLSNQSNCDDESVSLSSSDSADKNETVQPPSTNDGVEENKMAETTTTTTEPSNEANTPSTDVSSDPAAS